MEAKKLIEDIPSDVLPNSSEETQQATTWSYFCVNEAHWYQPKEDTGFFADFLRCRIDAERGIPEAVNLWTRFCTWKLKQ